MLLGYTCKLRGKAWSIFCSKHWSLKHARRELLDWGPLPSSPSVYLGRQNITHVINGPGLTPRFLHTASDQNWMWKAWERGPCVHLRGFYVFTILFIQLPYKVSYLAVPISCCKIQYSYPPEAVPPQIILLTSEVGNKHLFVHYVCPL